MNKNKKITQTMALAMTGIMIANAGMGSVYAADQTASVEKETESTTEAVTEKETEKETEKVKKETSKEETVYVQASPSGETQEIIVSDWLKNTDGETSLSDKSDLSDIKNVKGDETFSQDGDKITWDANGNDIYYQGTSTKDLPVSLKVTYYLDGQEISPEDLAGKSGHVKMVYQYTNHMKQGEIYTPFVLFTGMVLPGDNFSNVKVDNGKTISDGDKNIVIGVGLPGLEDSLKIKKNKSDILDDLDIGLDIPDSFEVEADVTDFSLSMSMTVATPLSLDDLELDDIDDEDDLKDKIDEIADAATQLVDGTSDLADGVQELKDGCGDLLDGIDQLDDGAGDLNNGVQTLNNKKGDLIDGINQLSSGLDQLNSKKGDLVKGVNQLASGASSLDSGAADLKTGMDKLAGGINLLNGNRETLVSGLTDMVAGINKMESKKAELTGGVDKLITSIGAIESGVDAAKEKIHNGLQEFIKTLELQETALEAGSGLEDIDGFTEQLKKYVTAVNGTLTQLGSQTSGSENGSQTVAVYSAPETSVDVSFAETSPEAIASLEASIAGNEAVLASLKDVQSKESSVPDKLLKEYSGAYSTYTGQLSNCIAQLESDIANQKAALAAMQQTQTVSAGQSAIAVQSDDAGENTGSGTGTSNPYQSLIDSGENLYAGAINEKTGLKATVKAGMMKSLEQVKQTVQGLDAQICGEVDEKTNPKGGAFVQISSNLELMKQTVKDELQTGVEELANGIGQLYEGSQLLSPNIPVLDSGVQSLAGGAVQLQAGLNSLKDGTATLSTGTKTLQSGAGALATGVQQLATGGKQLKKGGATLADGVQQLADGSSQLKDGTSQLKDGGKDLDSGVDELLDGANELKDGMEEFDEEAIQKLVDFADDDLQDMIDRLKDIRNAGDAYQLYSSGNENTNGNVKFIIETASIGDDE